MNEPIHDPTVTLRLELGRVTDQRDAYQKAFSTEVLKVVRVAIIQATIDADNEIARLKAEVERLRASSFVTAVPVEQYERLIKAGDAVCESPYLWETDPAVIAWRAAKEGKPSV